MRRGRSRLICAALILAAASAGAPSAAQQDALQMAVNTAGDRLSIDWPILNIGTAEYPDGPTGVTVFHFTKKVYSAIDVRGGGPGTVNAPYMALGYDYPELDTVVFAGGSWYGLETVTAVASALKDDGLRDGNAFGDDLNIAMSVGSIIFDFGARRLNEIYPDKRLAQAAFRAAGAGGFPQGAHGAGRFAVSGWFFGCNAHSGQGGAFREVGELKIAAFTVVNAVGVVTSRDGTVAACYREAGGPDALRTVDLFAELLHQRSDGMSQGPENTKNTTLSLVVTNQALSPAMLRRLAAQVHTSMARAIQPFATLNDGDVLYAVSTAEIAERVMSVTDLGAIASEVMWDAILASVPDQLVYPVPAPESVLDDDQLRQLAGDYVFSRFVTLRIAARGDSLYGRATGERDVYRIGRDTETELLPVSATDFMVPGRYPMTLRFDEPGRVLINPGHWQQAGRRADTR